MKDMSSQSEWLKGFSRVGMASKGFVYFLIGGLTLFSALNMGGEVSNKKDVVDFLQNQPFGNVILIVLAVGLMGFVCWRVIQVVNNPEDEDKKHRFAYVISGLFYGFFAITILFQGFGKSSSNSGGKEKYISEMLGSTEGKILLSILILGLLVKAFSQFKKVFGKKFLKTLRESSLKKNEKKIIKYLGYIGYTARGIVIVTVAYLFSKALIFNNSDQAGGTKEAFQLLDQSTSSSIILIIISTGLTFYGIYMLAKAKYKAIPSL